MNGTSRSHTAAMERIPPRITIAVSAVITAPVIHGDTWNVSWASELIEFACTMQPMPKAATAVNAAKTTASQRRPRPRSSAYMGPPAMVPCGVRMRYFTASTASPYLVAMPKTPVNHIQSTAPGPPAATAVATPTMLPVPMVAASAVVSAPNCETSPSPSRWRENDRRIARGK